MKQSRQSQASLLEQLKQSIHILNKAGLYDASDFVKNIVENQEKRK